MSIDEKLYAIIDVANLLDGLDHFKRFKVKYSCLYPESLKTISPYIVEIKKDDYDFVDFLQSQREVPWGFYFTSKANFISLRAHFRQYNWLTVSSQEKPVFFRYFDPRILWELLDILEDTQIKSFLGSITSITTNFINKTRTFDVNSCTATQLIMTEKQYNLLTNKIDDWHINKLFMEVWEIVQVDLEKEQNSVHEIHRKMILDSNNHINHILDLAMTHEGDPILIPSNNSLLWLRISKDSIITLDNIISQKLNEIKLIKIKEIDFLSYINDSFKNYYKRIILDKSNEISTNKNGNKNIENYHQLINDFVREFYFFCKKENIFNHKHMITILIFFIQNNIYTFEEIFNEWLVMFSQKNIPTDKRLLNFVNYIIINDEF